MKPTSLKQKRPDIVIPEEASGRGPILTGELRGQHQRYPGMLAQFERISPSVRKSRIYLFPTAEQAKRLQHSPQGPYTFEGTFCTREDVLEAKLAQDIWLKPITSISHKEAIYWSQTSGRIGSLETIEQFQPGKELDSRKGPYPAWFVARRCFALQILANQDEEEAAKSAKYGFSKPNVFLTLSEGATASIRRYLKSQRNCVGREVTRSGYSITVEGYKNPLAAKKDLDAILILASLASRERTVSSFWSYDTKEEHNSSWIFNFPKYPKRDDREEPLVRRDRDECRDFLQMAFGIYSRSKHQALLDSAVYALLDKKLTLETRLARLFSGIQGALVFATQHSMTGKRPTIDALYRKFVKLHPGKFDDLWPLLDPRQGPPLSYYRNAIVHGGAFGEADWLGMSYASELLQWHLERIILLALGWDIEKSSVSANALRHYFAHFKWDEERQKLARRS